MGNWSFFRNIEQSTELLFIFFFGFIYTSGYYERHKAGTENNSVIFSRLCFSFFFIWLLSPDEGKKWLNFINNKENEHEHKMTREFMWTYDTITIEKKKIHFSIVIALRPSFLHISSWEKTNGLMYHFFIIRWVAFLITHSIHYYNYSETSINEHLYRRTSSH